MSSSFRNLLWPSMALVGAASGAAQAQQTYFLPSFETSAEWHDNRDLAVDSARKKSNGIYYARAEALIGRVDQRSSIELRPWVSYLEVPDSTDSEPLEVGVNLRTLTETTKAQWRFNARYMQRDAVVSELGTAGFDSFDPAKTPTGDTGVVTVGGKRTDLNIYPRVTYRFTERTRLEARLELDNIDYTRSIAFRRVGYKSNLVEATLVHRLTKRFEVIAGPYATNFKADDRSNETDAYGLVLGAGFAPAQTAYVIGQLRAERSDVTTRTFTPVATESKGNQTTVGFEIVGHYSWPASRIYYNAGRFLEPGTIGSRVKNDTLRVQYNRFLSARLNAVAALRMYRDDRVDEISVTTGNKRLFADLSLYWQLTPTWYIGGGYRFLRQELAVDPRTANDNAISLQFGYRALDPRPRSVQ